MAFKKYLLSTLVIAAAITSTNCLSIPFSDSIGIVLTRSLTPAATRSAAAANRGSLSVPEKIGVLYQIAMAANVAYQFISVAKAALFPSTQQKLQLILFEKQLALLDAKAEFNAKLLLHRFEPKNAMGIPESCKQDALAFAMTAGIEELNKAVKEFKEAYGQEA